MRSLFYLPLFIIFALSGCAQSSPNKKASNTKRAGGGCEGCEAIYESPTPIPYPDAKIPAHIHVTIKEPDYNEYWIDEYLFDDDPLLTPEERKKQPGHGGNGIIKTIQAGDMLKAQRDIYLGKNIPDYPGKK